MSICKSCGMTVSQGETRCPNCFGMLQPIPEGSILWPQSELDSRLHLERVQGRLNKKIKEGSKCIGVGKDHLKRSHFDSAANAFRKAMEHTLNAWMIAAELEGCVLSGWICAEKELLCKDLDDVKWKPADQIAFLYDINLIDQDDYEKFEFLRRQGNKGSHAGGVVSKGEAYEAEETAFFLMDKLKSFCSAMSEYPVSDEWRRAASSKRAALLRYIDRLKADIQFLHEKNQGTWGFIERQTKHLEWASAHSSRYDVEETRRKIDDAKAEIAKRNDEIEARRTLGLQIRYDRERLMTLCDPEGYQKLLTDRKAERAAALERERQRQEKALFNKKAAAVCALAALAFILIIWILSTMGAAMGRLVDRATDGPTAVTSLEEEKDIAGQYLSSNERGSSSTGNKSLRLLESSGAEDGYILPDSSSRYYVKAELARMSLEELYYARNEIYARHGRGFKNADLQAYFNQKSWYERRYSPEQFDAMPSPLNDYEKKNGDLMLEVEKARNSPYLAG